MLRQILKQKSEITSCSVGSIRGLCVFRYYIKLTTKSSLNMFLKTMDSKDCKGHHWRQIWHGILYDSVVQRRWSPTGGCCSSRLGVSAEVFGTVPASLTGLFPYKKALVLMNMHETPTRGFIIREGAIYTPCCFKPVTVEVKCHQRFRKLSQVTLQGSYQRPMISLHWAFKLSTLLHVTNTSFSMLDFTSRVPPATAWGSMLNSLWSTVPWSKQVFSLFTTEAAAARRNRPWRTRPAEAEASIATERGRNYASVRCPLPLTSSLMPVLSSMWIHSWTGAAISLLLWDRCSCRGSPYTLWPEKLRGDPAESERRSVQSGTSNTCWWNLILPFWR